MCLFLQNKAKGDVALSFVIIDYVCFIFPLDGDKPPYFSPTPPPQKKKYKTKNRLNMLCI